MLIQETLFYKLDINPKSGHASPPGDATTYLCKMSNSNNTIFCEIKAYPANSKTATISQYFVTFFPAGKHTDKIYSENFICNSISDTEQLRLSAYLASVVDYERRDSMHEFFLIKHILPKDYVDFKYKFKQTIKSKVNITDDSQYSLYDIDDEILYYIQNGQLLTALKAYKEKANLGLKDSKHILDFIKEYIK